MKGSMDYPTHEESVDILARFDKSSPLTTLESVVTAEEMQKAIAELPNIYICRELMGYISAIVEKTRDYPRVVLGVSPRGALSLMKAAKGYAAIAGRDYVLPDDIKRAAHPVLEHRMVLENALRIRKNAAAEIIDDIIASVTVPTEAVFEARD
jgi:MoxR-like ATPase